MEEGLTAPEGFAPPAQPFNVYDQGNNLPSQMESSRPFSNPIIPQQTRPLVQLVNTPQEGILADSTGRVQFPPVPGQVLRQMNPGAPTQPMIQVIQTQPGPSYQDNTAVTQAQQMPPTFAAMQLSK